MTWYVQNGQLYINYINYLSTNLNSVFNFIKNNNLHLLYSNYKRVCQIQNHSFYAGNQKRDEISECITLIVNQSIKTGIYPDKLKVAKVVPIFKKEDKLQLKNYRPISALPVISKIFENVMLTQLVEYSKL